MINNLYKKMAIKRLGFSFVIVMVYIIGSNISVPGVNPNVFMGLTGDNPGLALALSVTGLSLENFSLFSIGLGPWMSTLIFWRVLATAKAFNLDAMTASQAYRWKFLFALGFGVIQALGLLSQMGPLGPQDAASRGFLVFFLLTGLTVIIWLGNMNNMYGFGGVTLIILINIMRKWPGQVLSQLKMIPSSTLNFFLIGLGALLVGVAYFYIFRFYQGERRLPLMHVMLDGTFSKESYLPIPVAPAGGMPYMYAFSMVLIPQYLLMVFGGGGSKYGAVRWLYTELQLNHAGGVLLLVATVVILTFGFSYVSVDHKVLAENMRNNGDYFQNVYPGKNTERYLFHKVSIMATVSALFNCMIIGLPMALSLVWNNLSAWAQLIPTSILVMVLMKEIYMQFQQTYHRNDYQRFVHGEVLYK